MKINKKLKPKLKHKHCRFRPIRKKSKAEKHHHNAKKLLKKSFKERK